MQLSRKRIFANSIFYNENMAFAVPKNIKNRIPRQSEKPGFASF
jgi:hypothetical protein